MLRKMLQKRKNKNKVGSILMVIYCTLFYKNNLLYAKVLMDYIT